MKTTMKQRTSNLVRLAMLIALIFVMQYLGTLISTPFKAIGIELSFVLIPIVIGAFLMGPTQGAILGLTFGVMTIVLTVTAPGTMTYILCDDNPAFYSLTALVKAIAAGWGAGMIYKALDKLFKGKNAYLRTLLASASAPVINTGIFLLGMTLFFEKTISEKWAGGENVFLFILGLIWINFVIEFAINVILTPVIIRIIELGKKKN